MKRFAIFSGLLLLTTASGCMQELREECAECETRWNISWAADSAYQDMAQTCCVGINCPHSFKDGFRAGFADVADGGLGCLPAVPKFGCCNHMWLDHCSDADKMSAWYDGFELGVIAAKNAGMSDAYRMATRIPQPAQVDYSSLNQKAQLGTAVPGGVSAPNGAPPPIPTTPYSPPLEGLQTAPAEQPAPEPNAEPRT